MARRTNGEGSVYRSHDHPTCPPVVDGYVPPTDAPAAGRVPWCMSTRCPVNVTA